MTYTDNKLITPAFTLASAINSTNPDLSPLKAFGGKLIMYHGWNDPNIPAVNSINYYDSVVAAMHHGHKKDFNPVAPVRGGIQRSSCDSSWCPEWDTPAAAQGLTSLTC